ncbi:MAG TPA: PAS domain-containing protein [Actinomycetota bacterium]|jgi:PAS domain-containing protein
MKQWDLRGITEEGGGAATRTAEDTVVTRIVERDVSISVRPNLESLRVLVDQLPAIFWTTDENFKFTSALGAGLASLGLGPNQIVGMNVHDFFQGADSPTLEAHRSALEGESVPFHLAWGDRVFQAHTAPLRDAEGRTIGTICVGVDGVGDGEEWHFLEAG